MSQTLLTTPSTRFQAIFNDALEQYKKRTKNDLTSHPLAAQLQRCGSPSAVLAILQERGQELEQSQSNDERLTKWLGPTVNVLYAFSETLSEGLGLVFSPSKVIFAGIGVLLIAAKEVNAGQDVLIDIFGRIENFLTRLETYLEVTPTTEMTNIMMKIMIEVLSILSIATKEIKEGRMKKYLRKLLVGGSDIENALKRLDALTQEETRMAIAQVLKASHSIEERVKAVFEGTRNVLILSRQFLEHSLG
ncbi:hypothetical protein BC826DRAFT_1042259 [Russula brevipes]|nr:hypothetical protein BC826DRAFT_1042259 [Russula brevipes]